MLECWLILRQIITKETLMPKTFLPLDSSLYDYMLEHGVREPVLARGLREETAKLEFSAMQISPDQAQVMAMLVKLVNAKRIIEIGSFTGYSALIMAQALPQDGQLVCCDISKEWTDIGQSYWQQAGLAQKIDLRLAPALDTLQALKQQQQQFDLAFIDADKENYSAYYDICFELLKPGGLILVDNVFWGGWVVDLAQQDADTLAIRDLNQKIAQDPRVDICMLPIGDGLTLARKKHAS